VGALLVGLSEGKGLALGLGVPFVPVNHIEGHALSPFLSMDGSAAAAVPEAFTALVVSGGHTHVFAFGGPRIERLARTRDDAAGEAFDKVAKMAGLGYPGGPAVDRLARRGKAQRPFALAQFKDGAPDFSFSGLKTAVSTRLAKTGVPEGAALADFCASFQTAVVDVLVRKSRRALVREGLNALIVCGGVAANRGLRAALAVAAREDGFGLFIPPPKRCTDNAAMIAAEGSALFLRGKRSGLDLAVDPGLPLSLS